VWIVLVVVVLVLLAGENKVNSYSDQLKLGWVCKFGVEFDNKERNEESVNLVHLVWKRIVKCYVSPLFRRGSPAEL